MDTLGSMVEADGRTTRPPHGASRWTSALALALCSVLVALVLGEVAVRWRGVDLYPSLKYRFHPRYGWTMDPSGLNLDGLLDSGFRSPPLDEVDDGGPRLLLLGDSFSVAVEHRWRHTFAGILDAELRARGGRLANLSSGGWGTAQEYRALVEEGLAWQPDVVVLQVFPYNDVCNNGADLAFTCSWQDYLRPYHRPDGEGVELTWLYPWRGRARAWSRLFGLVERQVHWRRLGSPGNTLAEFRRRTREYTRANAKAIGLRFEGQAYSLFRPKAQPEVVRRAWRATEALFAAIQRQLATREIPLVALVIPFSESFEPEWQDYRRRHRGPLEADYATRRSEAAFRRLGVPVISVRRRIEAEGLTPAELFNPFNQHFSRAGHRKVADWISEELVRLGL